jgi:serine/alanine adding enzyme
MTDTYSIEDLTAEDGLAWDDFVLRSARPSPYHLLGWRRAITETYGYMAHYLVAKTEGEIRGVLPLIEIRSRIMGDALTSLPGGICAATPEASAALAGAADERAQELGVDYFTLRDTFDPVAPGFETVNQHTVFVLDVPTDPDEVVEALPSNMRRYVRQGLKRGAVVASGTEDLAEFHGMFARFCRDVGTPVFSRQFIERVVDALPGHWMVVVIRDGDTVIGGGFQILLRDTVWGLWGGSWHESLDLRPNHLLVWECMRYASEHGLAHLNTGRSRVGSGQHKFKRQWGGEPYPLYQHFSLLDRESVPGVFNGAGPSRAQRTFSDVWRRLPVPLASIIGPSVRRHIPFG